MIPYIQVDGFIAQGAYYVQLKGIGHYVTPTTWHRFLTLFALELCGITPFSCHWQR